MISSVTAAPPRTWRRSRTSTLFPARARYAAFTSPLCPPPITITSYCCPMRGLAAPHPRNRRNRAHSIDAPKSEQATPATVPAATLPLRLLEPGGCHGRKKVRQRTFLPLGRPSTRGGSVRNMTSRVRTTGASKRAKLPLELSSFLLKRKQNMNFHKLTCTRAHPSWQQRFRKILAALEMIKNKLI